MWKRKKTMSTSKYSAKITECDGFKFSSKLEKNYYESMKLLQKSGQLKYFLRQVPFHLPGNVKYVVDFVLFFEDGEIRYIDVKGFDTALSKTKRKIVEATYPIKIEVVQKI